MRVSLAYLYLLFILFSASTLAADLTVVDDTKQTSTNETEVQIESKPVFQSPNLQDLPKDKYGDLVRWGRNIFINTQQYGKRYVGNGLNCSNCHLNEGRKPHAAPLWAAYGMYPMYRRKTRTVVTFRNRVQDCFRYSLDGIAPSVIAPEMDALVAYAQWLATGAPIGKEMPGRGFPVITSAEKEPSPERGKQVYHKKCSYCHGQNGAGMLSKGGKAYMFPPVWGSDSYNKGAGMHRLRLLSGFIKGNMPLGAPFSLSDQEAIDVASFIQIQSRPKDPKTSYIMDFFFPKSPN